jgi:sensor histidine kinase YesM
MILWNRVLHHTLFWGISYFVLLQLFSSSSQIVKIDYIYTAIFLVAIVVCVYINLLILIPKFLSKKRYILYGVGVLFVIAVCSELNIFIFDKLINYVLPDYYFISYYEFVDISKFTVTYVFVTSLLKLSKGWFQLSEANRQLSELQKEKIESELKILKGQINPHFLFNSMNSIYSLALNHSEKTPDIVLKLSDIMRYIIYEASRDFVDLTKEIKYLEDYIVLQKLRADSRATIKFEITGELKNIQIAPLLFFPLVENSFKHGIKGSTGKSFVLIHLEASEKKITFVIENNKGCVDNVEKKEYKGIGLENIKKRLAMIYPNDHDLKITDLNETFKVELVINRLHYEC